MKYLFLFLVIAVTNTNVSAQLSGCKEYGGTPAKILKAERRFKIKAVVGVSSATAREADYVEFKTMENIYSTDTPPVVLFAKDTPVFGVVTLRKARHFPLRRGKLELILEPLINWNGDEIHIAIARHGPVNNPDRRKRRNDPCKERRENCIAGRGNAAVAPLVPAIAAAGAGAVTAIAKDDDTEFIAATAFFTIAKEIGNLLNGTDVEVSKDEIFDLIILTQQVCKMPEKPKS